MGLVRPLRGTEDGGIGVEATRRLYASVLTLLPIGLGSLLGMATGVWSLAILQRPHVVAAFQAIEDDPEWLCEGPGALRLRDRGVPLRGPCPF